MVFLPCSPGEINVESCALYMPSDKFLIKPAPGAENKSNSMFSSLSQ